MSVSPSQISSEKEDLNPREGGKVQNPENPETGRVLQYQGFCSPKSLRQSHRPTRNSSKCQLSCENALSNSNSLRTSCITRVGMCHMWYRIQVRTKGHAFVPGSPRRNRGTCEMRAVTAPAGLHYFINVWIKQRAITLKGITCPKIRAWNGMNMLW